MTVSEAKDTLQKRKLKVGREIPEVSELGKDIVTHTNPEAGTVKKEGASIDLYVSKGGNVIKLKNYVGRDVNEAVDDLILKYNVDEARIKKKFVKSDSVESGKVVKQTPKNGGLFDLDGSGDITFEVSEGNQVTMPTYLQGGLSIKTVANVKAELQNMGVAASDITIEFTPTTEQNADGYVISSTPAQGQTFNLKGTKIVLTVLQFDATAASKAASDSASKSESESKAAADKSAEESKSKSAEEASKSKPSSSSSSSSTSVESTTKPSS